MKISMSRGNSVLKKKSITSASAIDAYKTPGNVYAITSEEPVNGETSFSLLVVRSSAVENIIMQVQISTGGIYVREFSDEWSGWKTFLDAAVHDDMVAASASATTASEQATISTNKAGEASNSATSALGYKNDAQLAAAAYYLYNITLAVPLTAGSFYNLATAIAAVPVGVKKIGLVLTFATTATNWESYKFIGADTSSWATIANWERQPKMSDDNWVGYVIDTANSCSEPAPKSTIADYMATELQRTGNLNFHKFGKSRIFNAFRPAIVNRATKNVDYWLDKDDMTKKVDGTISTPDWTTQNICIIVPTIYRAIVINGTQQEYRFDIAPFNGAELWHEESAHSIGHAAMDRTDTKLVSVVSSDVRFRGGNNNAGNDGTDATQIGRPATSISRTNFETYANNAGWEIGNIIDRTLWHELYALYFANSNCQLEFTTILTAEGYPQGGTGAGVTTWGSDWDTWNGYYPINTIGAGSMNVGCKVGVHVVTINGHACGIPVFFGIENLYGEIWEWIGGVNINKSAEIANGGTGISSVYVCSDFAKRSIAITADYTKVGEMARTDGWIKSLLPGWNIPLETNGSSSVIHISDYGYCANIPASGGDVYGLLFGGSASNGVSAGVRCSRSIYAPSFAHAVIGARLRAKITK